MNVEPKKIALGLVGAFVALSIWNDPGGAGETTGDFIGKTSDFLEDAFDKANEFSQNVVG
ncbi:MAG TPA: hypothetical protein VIL36_14945 [Acidimicrobiales bacterium]